LNYLDESELVIHGKCDETAGDLQDVEANVAAFLNV
jgi:hypothetical protein